jgi:CheY-like chemotaxis protein
MTVTVAAASVMVASDSADNADQIVQQLEDEFEGVRASIHEDKWAADFQDAKPGAIVLAFDKLDKARGYQSSLHAASPSVRERPHRTIVLCAKDELRAAVDLCKQEVFDDYVLYWPNPYDGFRLAMSIRIACRELGAARSSAPSTRELFTHARQLGELENLLDRQLSDGELRVAAARDSLSAVERDIAGAVDEFSSRLVGDPAASGLAIEDPEALAREFDELKRRQLQSTRRIGANAIEPMGAWTHRFKQQVEPALARTRVLAHRVRGMRPLVMVVDDDEFTRDLVMRALDAEAYDVILAEDGIAALHQLRRVQPDVILMDFRLPGLDGVAVVQRLKAAPHLAEIPVIMLTGDARRETLIRSVKVGAEEFVVKPFTRESLVAKLDRVLNRPSY